jgi:ribose-phosphate pyrophosphokinase
VPGESFSLKVFANLINGLNFERVTVVDPHSDVAGAVFDRLTVITQFDVINRFEAFSKAVMATPSVFVSPDAGANKKTSVLAGYFNHSEFIRADKLRDLTNGNIKETIVYAEDLSGRTVVIADDLCDGGKTFIELAKVLRTKGAAKVILYVTHGIFSKGIKTVLSGGIDQIYMTDSFNDAINETDNVKILRLEETFKV